jgi:hypothetical protein
MTTSTTITEHSQHVATETSAATLVTDGVLTTPVTNMIAAALEQQGNRYEYGVTTAIDGESNTRYTTTPTKGYRKGIAPTGIPDEIVANQTTRGMEPSNEPSLEMTGKYNYTEFVGIHTHPVLEAHDTGGVGLSANDIRDDVFAGNTVSRARNVFDVYRAKAAIVFTNDRGDLPIQTSTTNTTRSAVTDNWISNGDVYPEDPLLDSRPDVRPWLHMVERTSAGVELTQAETQKLHNTTIRIEVSGTPDEQYQQVRNKIDEFTAELLIPLSP